MKYAMGYLSKWFPSQFEKMFVVGHADPRIHFALNCGATSCPPIAFYKSEHIDQQLDLATSGYLQAEASYNREKNEVIVPAIMSWFRGDFGGKSGIIDFLKRYEIILPDSHPTVKFSDFNWTLKLNNFAMD